MPSIEDFLSAAGPAVLAERQEEDGLVSRPEGGVGDQGLSPTPESDWVLPVEHLSSSSLNMLAICPRQFQQRYILGIKDPPRQPQIVGSAFHETMETNFRQKIETFQDLPTVDLKDMSVEEIFPRVVQEEQENTGFEIVWEDHDDALLSLQNMVVGYREDTAPSVVPKEVEIRFEAEVPGVPAPLVGMIDVVEEMNVIDLKTSKRKIKTMKPAWRVQAEIYQVARPLPTQFHIITTRGEVMPKIHLPYSMKQWASTLSWVHDLAWSANYYYKEYGVEKDWPQLGKVHDWRCGWCAYKSTCPAWRA